MRFFVAFLAAILTLVFVVALHLGCASLGLTPPTIAPATVQDRVAKAQQDLNDAYRIANDAHILGLLSPKQWKLIQDAYPVAQSTLNLAESAVADQQPDALTLLDKAAQAVADYRKLAGKS